MFSRTSIDYLFNLIGVVPKDDLLANIQFERSSVLIRLVNNCAVNIPKFEVCVDLSGWTPARNISGAIVYESPVDGKLYHFTQLFLSRELWGVDAFALNATHCKNFTPRAKSGYVASTYVERVFMETLGNYLEFAKTILTLPPPLQLEAGLTGVKDYPLAVQHGFQGRILTNHLRWTGTIPSYELSAEDVLKPFFDYMWAECGIVRPQSA